MHHIPKTQSITSILLLYLACTTITVASIQQKDSNPAYTIRTSLLNTVKIVYSKEWEKLNQDPSNAKIGTLNITEDSDIIQLEHYRNIFENQQNTSRTSHNNQPIILLITLQHAKKNHNIYQKINNTTYNRDPYHVLPIAIILEKISATTKCIDIKKSLRMRANNKITIADISLFYNEQQLKNNTKLGSLLQNNPNTSKDNNTDLEILYSLSAKYINAFERRQIQKNKNKLKHFLHITEKKATDTLNIGTKGIEQLHAINWNPDVIIKLKIKLEEEQFATHKKVLEHINPNHVLKTKYTFPKVNINKSILSIKATLINKRGNFFHKKYLNITYNNRRLQDSQTLREIVQHKNSRQITLKYNLLYFPLLYTLCQLTS